MIGIFDSGLGGLSVLQAVKKKMPQADIVYFGDTENAPYGNKSAREIGELIGMALRRLHAAGATDIISACNSASVSVHSVPIDLLRLGVFNVVEMVEPTVEALVQQKKKIVLFATNATVRSGIYQDAFAKSGVPIDAVAIPELAGLIEEGVPEREIFPVIRRAVAQAAEKGAEIISLSCTHYPFVLPVFEKALVEIHSVAELFDPAEAVAEEAVQRFNTSGRGLLRLLVSKKTPSFTAQAERLFKDLNYTIEEAGSIYWALKTV